MKRHKLLYTSLAGVIGAVMLYDLCVSLYFTIKHFYLNFSVFMSLLLPAMAIAGIIISYSSGFKKTALLRLFLCIEVFSFPFTIFFYTKYLTDGREADSYKNWVSWQFIMGIFLSLITATCSAVLLWNLSREKKPKLVFVQYGEQQFDQFEPAGRWLRFANRLVDAAVIIYIIYSRLIEQRSFLNFRHSTEYDVVFLIEGISLIGFYLLLEGIFNTTPGKCATNTIIVNADGQRPNFGQILGRTFCRLIPFDALSFLFNGSRGWHDSISRTYVVEAAYANAAPEEITLDAELNKQP